MAPIKMQAAKVVRNAVKKAVHTVRVLFASSRRASGEARVERVGVEVVVMASHVQEAKQDVVVVEEAVETETTIVEADIDEHEPSVKDKAIETPVQVQAQAQEQVQEQQHAIAAPAVAAVEDEDNEPEMSEMQRNLRAALRKMEQRKAAAAAAAAKQLEQVQEEPAPVVDDETNDTESIIDVNETTIQDDLIEMEDEQEQKPPVSVVITIGVLSRRAAVAESLNTTFDATLDESAIDLGDMDDVMAETLAAPKRNNIKASNKATTKIPAINCDIASYALQKSSLVDAARARGARGGLQREASLASLSSRSTDVSEEEWN